MRRVDSVRRGEVDVAGASVACVTRALCQPVARTRQRVAFDPKRGSG